jgi:hypothetical protein
MSRGKCFVKKRIRRVSKKDPPNPKNSSVNKYAALAKKSTKRYKEKDKTYREILTPGQPGEVIKKGHRQIFHERLYELMEDLIIPEHAAVPHKEEVHSNGFGRYKLVMQCG